MRFFPPSTSNNLKGSGMIFYCKDCEKIVDVFPVGRKFVYKCSICKTKNVAFGTEKSIRNFFHVEESATPAVTTPAAPAPVAEKVAPVEAGKPAVSTEAPKPVVPQTAHKPDSGPSPIPENK